MIITVKKPLDEILKSVSGANTLFIVSCGSCAAKCGTGDQKAVSELKEFLEKNGKTVLGNTELESACDMRLAKKDLLKNECFQKADAVIMLSCGAGSQSVEKISEKVIIPALNSRYVGSTERIGVYKKFCGICGECILIETQGICPRTRCPKSLVNGPCGGFVNGKCETDQTKDCAWVLIYEKLKKNGKLDKFLKQYIQPKQNKEY
ncbi:MAG: methylenetetrahydrofolate reductase C-terminal domain-containing protein [Endomicrobia bacterium]|nr:methylenetetrahydrofolate reductase C-terminal domain-containing protein [Endomicrobiia bacterium]MCL2799201.1 methylenetetrahydrofolate reductase C-terminal domain-containing protein [Endomicrobiia bacterium]